jgi:hypothetical protein
MAAIADIQFLDRSIHVSFFLPGAGNWISVTANTILSISRISLLILT